MILLTNPDLVLFYLSIKIVCVQDELSLRLIQIHFIGLLLMIEIPQHLKITGKIA